MSERYDVAVVGAGVIALACAEELLTRGLSVGIVGAYAGDHAGQATRAAGAMLSTFSEIEPGHDNQRIAVETAERLAAHAAYPGWLERLSRHHAPALTMVPGTWVLAPAGRHEHLAPIAAAAREAGHPAEEHDARQIPGLQAPADIAGALWLPTEARIDSAALMDALARVVRRHPRAEWHDTTAAQVTTGRVRCADGSEVRAKQIVVAAGSATSSLLSDGGRAVGLPPVLAGRGASMVLHTPAVRLPYVVRTSNAAFACGAHLVPRADGSLYLGATNRLTTGHDHTRTATLDELSVLVREASMLLDARLASAELRGYRSGNRPYTLDHLPLLGRTADPSLLVATATYRCGIMLAPRIAALIADEITTAGALDDHPYRALRPMPTPQISKVLHGAGDALLEHLLQGGASLPAPMAEQLAGFVDLALRALLHDDCASGSALRRLWRSVPVIEAVPALFALPARMKDTTDGRH
ncbi:FAD-dependent oxidoreductase [Actinoplanes sp. TBRC 11911]|uniref:NAD(P)/FAD-dependent oxidoreductase n=1 Tax=Actinoplanes sp. TBRC 11911 TaxID=2729386 RepID=UPI00145CC7CC|nr:FAD-dependent oxidoreductase [Actinoplanes sp. TBRC 11911]NMO50694.1 FAD-dependent oxidoreductase [Actinoplanes sp. TBRC 11911]